MASAAPAWGLAPHPGAGSGSAEALIFTGRPCINPVPALTDMLLLSVSRQAGLAELPVRKAALALPLGMTPGLFLRLLGERAAAGRIELGKRHIRSLNLQRLSRHAPA